MLVIILLLLVLQNVLWYFILRSKIKAVLDEVKKGNKDQQEIKTRLTTLKRYQAKLLLEVVKKLRGEVTYKLPITKKRKVS